MAVVFPILLPDTDFPMSTELTIAYFCALDHDFPKRSYIRTLRLCLPERERLECFGVRTSSRCFCQFSLNNDPSMKCNTFGKRGIDPPLSFHEENIANYLSNCSQGKIS